MSEITLDFPFKIPFIFIQRGFHRYKFCAIIIHDLIILTEAIVQTEMIWVKRRTNETEKNLKDGKSSDK